MRKTISLGVLFTVTVLSILLAAPQDSRANDAVALTGQVSAQKERLMEGVRVGAKKDRSTVSLNVSTDAKGRFNFPAANATPCRWASRKICWR